jgi:hypothetical protein
VQCDGTSTPSFDQRLADVRIAFAVPVGAPVPESCTPLVNVTVVTPDDDVTCADVSVASLGHAT